MFEIEVKPGTSEYRDLMLATVEDDPITLRVTEPRTEARFEVGDPVTVEFDDGPGPAVVIGLARSGREEYVRVSYGPKGKYSTSLPKYAVRTSNTVFHPATVQVIR
jgi:hypothetical protein